MHGRACGTLFKPIPATGGDSNRNKALLTGKRTESLASLQHCSIHTMPSSMEASTQRTKNQRCWKPSLRCIELQESTKLIERAIIQCLCSMIPHNNNARQWMRCCHAQPNNFSRPQQAAPLIIDKTPLHAAAAAGGGSTSVLDAKPLAGLVSCCQGVPPGCCRLATRACSGLTAAFSNRKQRCRPDLAVFGRRCAIGCVNALGFGE